MPNNGQYKHIDNCFWGVIGNPPYVQLRKIDYKFLNGLYKSIPGKNLYSLVIERCISIIHSKSLFGMIVPISICSGEKFADIADMVFSCSSWISSFSNRPGKLFDGVEQRLSIFIMINLTGTCYSSPYNHWLSEERDNLFTNLAYYTSIKRNRLPIKTGTRIAYSVINKIFNSPKSISFLLGHSASIWFHDAPTYWVRSLPFFPEGNISDNSSHYHQLETLSQKYADFLVLLLESSAFYISFKVTSNCRDFGINNIEAFRFRNVLSSLDELVLIFKQKLQDTAKDCTRHYTSGEIAYKEYYPAKCKDILDAFDTMLAMDYCFNETELDWVINYDIKYRLGEEESESDD